MPPTQTRKKPSTRAKRSGTRTKKRATHARRPKPEFVPLRVSALTAPQCTRIAGTVATPPDAVAAYLAPLERVTNGPAIPVLRYLLEKCEPGKSIVVMRAEIAESTNITPRHVSRALASLLEEGFIRREDQGGGVFAYGVNATPVKPRT